MSSGDVDSIPDCRSPPLPCLIQNPASSRTDVPVGYSFSQSTKFQAWDGFEVLVNELLADFERLDSRLGVDWKWEIEETVRAIWRMIFPSTTEQSKQCLHQVLKSILESQDGRGGESSEGHALGEGAERADSSYQAKVHERGTKVYTNSTSAILINAMTFDIVEKLVRALEMQSELYLLNHIRVSATNFKHLDPLCDVCKATRDKGTRPVERGSLRGDRPEECEYGEQGSSSATGESAKQECSCPGNRMKMVQIPDFALATVPVKDTPALMPTCTFELKASSLPICGSGDCTAHFKAVVTDCYWRDSELGAGGEQDRRTYEAARDVRQEEVLQPEGMLSQQESSSPQGESVVSEPKYHSAAEIARQFNAIFCYGSDWNGFNAERRLYEPIAQTLCQGLLTKTGVCALDTQQELICFEIDGEHPQEPGVLVVKVSRSFSNSEDKNNVLARVALIRHSLRELRMDSNLPEKVRRSFRLVMNNYERMKNEGMGRGVGNLPMGLEEEDDGSEVEHDDTAADPDYTYSGTPSDDLETEDEAVESDTVQRPGGKLSLTHVCETVTELGLSSSSDDQEGGTADATSLTNDVELRRISSIKAELARRVEDLSILLTGEVVGSGSTSEVMALNFRGHEMVAKIWNELDLRGLREMRKEINAYKLLFQRGCPSLDFGVPLLMASKLCDDSALLVLQRVGVGVRFHEDGKILLDNHGDDLLSAEDICGIREAALRSLAVLHGRDLLHGDLNLHNLQVERMASDDGVGEVKWRAWWVDLGRASDVRELRAEDRAFFKKFEELRCSSLFYRPLRMASP